jgi:hypothetical protein
MRLIRAFDLLNPNTLRACVLSAFLGLLFLPSYAADKPIEAIGSLEVVIPSELKSLHIDNPSVLFKVDIGADSTIYDAMAIESVHRDLIPAATKKLLAAKFTPAEKNGMPIRSRAFVYVRFFDPEQRAWRSGSNQIPFGGSVTDAVQRRMYVTAEQRFVYGESQPDEIDKPIKSLTSARRLYAGGNGITAKGRCLVEFYVSPEGRARFPSALESDSDEVSISAALTLMKTRFSPPRRAGQPTFIKVQQEFIFQ